MRLFLVMVVLVHAILLLKTKYQNLKSNMMQAILTIPLPYFIFIAYIYIYIYIIYNAVNAPALLYTLCANFSLTSR